MSDPLIRQFIEKCLVPASERLSAKELLKDPFLQVVNTKEQNRDPLELPNQSLKAIDGPLSMDIDTDSKQLSLSTCTGSNIGSPSCPVLEFERTNGDNKFRLRGTKNDDSTVSLTLRIADSSGKYPN